MNSYLKLLAVVIGLIGFCASPALAGGTLAMTKSDGEVVKLSMSKLMAMPATEIYTSAPGTDGVQKFKGVSFDALFEAYGIDVNIVRVSALNDYNVMVPANVLREDGAILAYHLNDGEMSIREKGPFWVIFPYDADVRFQTDTYWSYSVWQVKSVDEAN